MAKKKRRDKSDYGDNFVAPDGGWAWVICVAGGISNLVILPVFQQFGLLFRDKLANMGLNNSQITGIVNANAAISSMIGFLNGPIFRRFSHRQVALTGAVIATMGIILTSLANSFRTFFLAYSVLLGIGFGINMTATLLSFNTYFKEKRQKASSYMWTITGLGPVFFPYLVTWLLTFYSDEWTSLIVGAISANSIACALTYQPVLWHVKTKITEDELEHRNENIKICDDCECVIHHNANDDDDLNDENDNKMSRYEVIPSDPETPMLLNNDPMFNSKESIRKLSTPESRSRSKSIEMYLISNERSKSLGGVPFPSVNDRFLDVCTCNDKNQSINSQNKDNQDKFIVENPKISWYQKFVNFFELDLLKDLTFVNMSFGVTITLFAEINFTLLTPFFLNDFGLTTNQIAFLMSVPAIPDLIVRFLVQFLVKKIKWDNRVFYLIGIFTMTVCRIVIAENPGMNIMFVAFLIIGVGKGLRTIFMGLILPSYVPLKKLPAASGLHRLVSGLFSLLCGPIVGRIRDATNYKITLNFLNVISLVTVVLWTIEMGYKSYKRRRNPLMVQSS